MANLQVIDKTEAGKYEIVNYEELKAEVADIVKPYTTMVVDISNLKTGKEIVAKLNKVSKILNDTRIKSQKKYMEAFEHGKSQFDELIDIIGTATANLKNQINEIEDEYTKVKKEKIEDTFNGVFTLGLISLNQIYDNKWENKTYKLETIREEMETKKEQIKKDIEVLKSIVKGDKVTYLLNEYFKTLSMADALNNFKQTEDRTTIIKKLLERETL